MDANLTREEKVLQLAQDFTELPEDLKEKFAWYLLGRQEEREKHEVQKKAG